MAPKTRSPRGVIDAAVSVVHDEEAERLVHDLSTRGYRVEKVIEQTRTARLATARLRHEATREIFIDLLFASSGIEPELVAGAEPIGYGRGRSLPVARTGHLIALKILSESEERLQDRLDLRALALVATDEDWSLAEASLRLIRARGFHRGRALMRRLRAWRRAPR